MRGQKWKVKKDPVKASCIRHRLSNTVYSGNDDTIRLFPDDADGQNKNTIVITVLLTEAPKNIKTILLHFPVPGHSYIPSDSVFGVVERKVRKIENIIHLNEYIEIFKESGTVTRVGLDFEVHDWKIATEVAVKKPSNWHFQYFPCKRFIFQRGRNNVGLVQGEVAYTIDLGVPCSIAKKGQRVGNFSPRTKVNSVPLNPNKLKDFKSY
ncbi:hypothetical protein ANN_03056 [Periplaneta americana]|uniref:Transposase n=1 Tax=Periplaneta americana TaxID=6978 RepID=A0ABQ8TXZ1_PERAM|nr:hypothetical protein ANN_03056 [Periplaneta americana]